MRYWVAIMCDSDRPPTNMEMFEYSHAKWDAHWDKVERDGCCGDVIRDSGYCPRTCQPCPLYKAAAKIEKATFRKVIE